jgi:2-polyprenyl-6-hydroxyphenyl methylase/3-demethylubiquinone-9 3-methyltransferase
MRLPNRESLVDPDHIFLYGHDCKELHNPDNSDFSRLHYLSRFKLVLGLIRKYVPAGVVLDAGCAQGNFSLALAESGYRVVALDLRPSFLKYLRMKHERGDVTCTAASIERFPFRPGQFDLVLLGELLEHVAQPERLLGESAALLKPGGILLATTPNGERLHTGLPTLSAVTDRESLRSRQFQPDADGHLFLLTRNELMRIVKQADLEVLEHRVFGTPWVTGRLMARHIVRAIPVGLRWILDRLTLRVPVLKRMVSDGQLLVARVPNGPSRAA